MFTRFHPLSSVGEGTSGTEALLSSSASSLCCLLRLCVNEVLYSQYICVYGWVPACVYVHTFVLARVYVIKIVSMDKILCFYKYFNNY